MNFFLSFYKFSLLNFRWWEVIVSFFALFSFISNQKSFAQSGQKWITNGNSISSTDFLGTTNNQPLRLFTSNTEKLRITPQGYVRINTTNPQYLLDVNGRGRCKGWLLADSNLKK